MATWSCPACGRQFGRRNQSHVCVPAGSVEDYFAARAREDRAIFEAVAAHLHELGTLTIDPVGVGILFKRSRTFAELRPRREGFSLSVLLSRTLVHPRITRTLVTSGRRRACFVHLRQATDVDPEVRAWLTEAYFDSPP